ncbi:hypothetical protein [Lutibacter maritimus]|uniref:Uncharacterized protein n=1 Tax=Lutibacter maritimus TaxID=593133 RepID=A0A1I6NSM2_9FLAO|nr:hypothetical protein [Lutibacter maritimus]SFS30845.1 hypothetical protein SAMN04488006_0495 [Lutibacter maritimus]
MSWIHKILKLKVKELETVETPVYLATVDEDGLFGKTGYPSKKIDGGAPDSVYLPTQKCDGGEP